MFSCIQKYVFALGRKSFGARGNRFLALAPRFLPCPHLKEKMLRIAKFSEIMDTWPDTWPPTTKHRK
jgi:hypothetical protein